MSEYPIPPVWEVWQGNTLVCSRHMKLTESEARNKVDNERRMGWHMEARPAGPEPLPAYLGEDEDD